MLGKTWGLKPKMTNWLYITVVRPIITYASLVWWPKVEQRTAQNKLQRLQRLACLAITGAMHTCPTAAMEALIGLLPLYLHIRREAMSCATRLAILGQIKLKTGLGHLRILEDVPEMQMGILVSDLMPKQKSFGKKYKILLTNRSTWDNGGPKLESGTIMWYTDGSVIDGGTGAGLVGPNCRRSIALGAFPTIFQAEIYAIMACARINIEKGMRGAKISVATDSQAAIGALSSCMYDSKLVWECQRTLQQLAQRNKVNLM